MDSFENKVINHYFKKYKKKNNMFNGFQFIADKNINYNDLYKNKILTQIAGTRRKKKGTNCLKTMETTMETFNKYAEYIFYYDFVCYFISFITGLFLAYLIRPEMFVDVLENPYYDTLGAGVANAVMTPKPEFAGNINFPPYNFVVRVKQIGSWRDRYRGDKNIQSLNNQSDIPWTITHNPFPNNLISPGVGSDPVLIKRLRPVDVDYINRDKKGFVIKLIDTLKQSLSKKVFVDDNRDVVPVKIKSYVLIQDLHNDNIMLDENENLILSDLDFALTITESQRNLIMTLLDQLASNIYGALNTDSVIMNTYGEYYRFFYDHFNRIIKQPIEYSAN